MPGAVTVGSLIVNMSANVSGLKTDLADATNSVKTSSQNIVNAWAGVTAETDKATFAGARIVAALKEEIATFGMTNAQLTQHKANLSGVGAEAQSLIARLSGMKAAEDAFKASVADASSGMSAHGAAASSAAGHMDKLNFSTVGARRELLVLAHEALNGNWSKFGGSMMVLGERTDAMGLIFSATGAIIAGVAAVIGVFAVAVALGAKETSEFNNQMALTGGYAGITKGQFNDMAASIASSSHVGIGAAKDAMQGLVASGKFTGDTFSIVAKTAVDFADKTGTSSEDVLKDFEKMTDGVTKWAAEHDKQYHFLSAAQYAHIAALEEEGKVTQAIQATMEAFDQHLKSNEENLGILGKTLRLVKGALSEFWDAAKGVGRAETVDDKIKSLNSQIENYNPLSLFGPNIKDLNANLASQQESKRMGERAALRKSEDDQIQASAVKAIEANNKIKASHLSRAEQEQRDVKAYLDGQAAIAAADSSLVDSDAQRTKTLSAIHEDYAVKAKKAAEEKISDYDRLMTSMNEQLAVQNLALASDDKLTSGQKLAAKTMDDLRTGVLKLTQAEAIRAAKMLEQVIANDQALEAKKAAIKMADDLVASGDKELQSLDDQIAKQKDVNDQMGLTKAQIDDLKSSKLLDGAATDEQVASNRRIAADFEGPLHNAYLQYADDLDLAAQKKRELAGLQNDAGEKQRVIDAGNEIKKQAASYEQSWQASNKAIGDGLYSAIGRGGSNAIQKLIRDAKEWFARLVLNPIISPIAAFGASLINPGAASAATGGGTSDGITALSAGKSLWEGFSAAGSVGTGFYGSLVGGLNGAGVGSGLTSSLGLSMGNSIASALGPQLSSALSTGLSGVAAAIPWVGAAIAAYALISSMTGGETRGGGQYGYSFDGTLTNNRRGTTVSNAAPGVNLLEGPSGGEVSGDAVRAAIDSTVAGINATLKGLGSSAALSGFQAGIETSDKGRGGVFAGGQLSNGAAFGLSGAGSNYNGTLYDKAFSTSPDATKALTDFSTELKQTTIQALQAATDIPKSISNQLSGVNAKQLTDATATALLTSISTEIAAVNDFRTAVISLPFDNLKNLSFDAADSLIRLSGGVAQFSTNIAAYYQNYYSDQEKVSTTTAQMTKAFSDLGYALPGTKAALRAMIEAQNLSTDAGRQAYAQLMALTGAFSSLSDASAQLASSAEQAAAATAQAASDAAKANLDALQKNVDTARSALTTAYGAESAALNATITSIKAFAVSIADFRDSLLLGASSPLSPEDQYATAKAQYQTTLVLAQGGDNTAQGQLQASATAFLTASKAYNASTDAYAKDFNAVQSGLTKMEASAISQVSAAEQQLTALNQQVSGLITINDSVLTVAQAIAGLQSALTAQSAVQSTDTTAPSISGAFGTSAATDAAKAAMDSYGQQNGQEAYYFIAGVNDYAAKLANATTAAAQIGVSVSAAFDLMGHSQAYWQEAQRQFDAGLAPTASSIKGFAVGTNYLPSDMIAQVHQGERIIPAADNRELMARLSGPASGENKESVAELKEQTRQLRALVSLQQAANQALIAKMDNMTNEMSGIRKKAKMQAAA